jgi:hypothetical protein
MAIKQNIPTTRGDPFILVPVFSLVFAFFLPVFSLGTDFYKWIDENGLVHITDNMSQVPPQYRDQVDKKNPQMNASPDGAIQQNGNRERPKRTASGLKHFEVPYLAFEGTSRRIIIPVKFNESIEARLLLDTGSPSLMISPKLASRLGFLDGDDDSKLKIKAAGIGGSVTGILVVVDSIRVGDAHSEFLPATVAKIPSNEFEGLVGMDFMSNYKIGIDTDHNVVAFDELAPQADRPGGHDEAWWRDNFQYFTQLRTESARQIDELKNGTMISSEQERRLNIAKKQFDAAEELCRKLERYARENAVPTNWKR